MGENETGGLEQNWRACAPGPGLKPPLPLYYLQQPHRSL